MRLLIIAMFTLVSLNSHAAGVERSDFQRQFDQVESDIKAREKILANLKNELKKKTEEHRKLFEKISDAEMVSANKQALARALEIVNKSKDEFKASIDAVQTQLLALDLARNQLQEKNNAILDQNRPAGVTPAAIEQNKLKNDLEALGYQVRTQGLQMRVADLKLGASNLDQAFDRIERDLDQTVVGAYMKDKVGQLMNSKLICEVVNKRCSTASSYPIESDKLDEIFPNTKSFSRQNTYEKVKARSAQ